MPILLRRVALLAVLLLLSLPPTARAVASPGPSLVAIPGTIPDVVRAGLARALGPVVPSQRLHLAIALAPRDQSGMNAALTAIYNPASTAYHRYLIPATFSTRFGPDPTAVRDLAAWLGAQGLQVHPWSGGMVLDVDGDAVRMGAAFHVALQRYLVPSALARSSAAGHTSPGRIATRREAFAPTTDPLLPARFAPVVTAIVGLSRIAPASSVAHASRPLPSGPVGGYDPTQIATAYDFQPLYAAGYHGEHTRVALVELSPYQQGDLTAYQAQYGPGGPVTDHTIDAGNAAEPPNVEATMDIELLSSAVPGAAIDVYNAPNDGTATGLLDAYSAVASSNTATVLALTWVNCEPEAQGISGFIGAQHTLFKQLALQGTTIVSATGDAGAFACSDQPPAAGSPGNLASQPSVNLPASDPYVLAVGATDLVLGSASGTPTINSESAWSCPVARIPACGAFGFKGGGSGGGLSQVFRNGDSFGDDLSWQTGPGVSNPSSNGARQVPDVSISGSFGISNDHEYSIYWQGTWRVGGGTSSSTPMWAALILLTDQYLLEHGAKPAGWINPLVYQLGAAVQPYAAYHDITTGNNLLYSAGKGWDYASGWGSPDAWNFVRDIAGFSPSATATLTTTATPPTSTGTVTALPTGTPSATTTLTATHSSTPTVTITPRPSATRTPTPVSTPVCPPTGLGNGGFQTGTLACWHAGGTPLPRISTTMHAKNRFSVQIGSGRPGQRAASVLSQTFTVPAGRAPALHLNYWLSRLTVSAAVVSTTCRLGCGPPVSTTRPILSITGPGNRTLVRIAIVPHRERAWSGLRVPLPLCAGTARCPAGRVVLTLSVPAQPPGTGEVLYLDDAYLGT